MMLFKEKLFKPMDNVHISPYRINRMLSNLVMCGVKIIKFEGLYLNLLICLYDNDILSGYGINIDIALICKIKKFINLRKTTKNKTDPGYLVLKHWVNSIHDAELKKYKLKLINLYAQCVNIIHDNIKECNNDGSVFILDTDEIYLKDDIDLSFIDLLGIPYVVEYIDGLVYRSNSYISIYNNEVSIKGNAFIFDEKDVIIKMKEEIRNNNIENILK